ncbi:MAG TPA: type VI secretion system tube protein Hcp [Dehalococcoidia bacterium]|nr:type VI secretion system tube protein Hcp [Dehalococcoidia bacterium]
MAKQLPWRTCFKAAFYIVVLSIIVVLAVSCDGSASPATGEASPTATVSAPLPGPMQTSTSSTGAAEYQIFLFIKEIPGSSKDPLHKDWIDVHSYSHDISKSASASACQHESFTVFKLLDKASPKLALYCCNGQRLNEAKLDVYRLEEGEQTRMTYTMTGVVISSVSLSSSTDSGDVLPLEGVSFDYSNIEWRCEYRTQSGATEITEATWDVIGGKGE